MNSPSPGNKMIEMVRARASLPVLSEKRPERKLDRWKLHAPAW